MSDALWWIAKGVFSLLLLYAGKRLCDFVLYVQFQQHDECDEDEDDFDDSRWRAFGLRGL